MRRLFWITLWLSKRLQTLSFSLKQKQWLQKPSRSSLISISISKNQWIGFSLLLLAFALGIWANQLTETAAIEKWEKTYLPSSEILHFAFGSRHLKEIKDLSTLQKILRTLPNRLDEAGTHWMTQDSNWVASYSRSDLDQTEDLDPQIHCLDCSQIPQSGNPWNPIGRGWRGLEHVLNLLDQKIKTIPTSKKPSAAGSIWKDPRAIIY